MKPYKQRRKEFDERMSRKPKVIKRSLWLKYTRQLAISNYRWFDEDMSEDYQWDVFIRKMIDKSGGLNCDVFEIKPYFDIYIKCIKKLKQDAEKAKFLQQNYKPLESDLFEI